MQLTGTKRLKDGRQMLPAGGYSEPTENQGIMDMETGEIIALSKKDQRIADAKKNRKEIMEKLQAKVDKENAESAKVKGGKSSITKPVTETGRGAVVEKGSTVTGAWYRGTAEIPIYMSRTGEVQSRKVKGHINEDFLSEYKTGNVYHIPSGLRVVSTGSVGEGRKAAADIAFNAAKLGINWPQKADRSPFELMATVNDPQKSANAMRQLGRIINKYDERYKT